MAKPPAGSSLLFGALAVSGRIKQRKNGSYRMVLKGIDEIDWFTDRPNRAAGEWSPKQLVKEWDVLFSDGAGTPNAQATVEAGGKRKLVTFEMFKPKLSDSNQTLSFKVRGIGKKNKDLLTGLRNKQLSDALLFIDDGIWPPPFPTPKCSPNCEAVDLSGKSMWAVDLSHANLSRADLSRAYMWGATLSYSNLTDANLSYTNLSHANVWYSDLTDANLSHTNLSEANVRNTKLINADLTSASFWYAFLNNSNLSGANLNNADLGAAHLTNANLNNADLTDATLTGANIINANLTDANLSNAKLSGANLTDATLTGANLTGANLEGATLPGANLEGAFLPNTIQSATWSNTTCPNGDKNSGTSPCTGEQLQNLDFGGGIEVPGIGGF